MRLGRKLPCGVGCKAFFLTQNSVRGEQVEPVQIDKAQRGWALASLGILAAGVVVYLAEVWSSPPGAR